jgi:exportin-2 (importin alpha re-exporter)
LKDLTTNAVQIVMSNPNAVSEAMILEVLVKIFYNLNFQDLHPKYEDTLDYWMNVLKAVMKLPNVN